ncbi:N-acetylmuramoyl-L-alanine amidase [Dyella nitratireducens]|uniref:N-acetylmuramoyl-L-alanine amidase n=1 Tax=Dyella nitratireducens TaxID=1849580 RepID=A0ABQ1FKN1_9GAMM|nr:N-acetylmuramoyl-L-alanine amidase [Dyella nitratireducens]GGA18912.1 N-acetylmuramoyl-L-alanine amidase [Dyella nitratireducens]GLQ44590.1 N-acetylmuramoyl-L-alanine amidase [Dyella nitratireducens]
MRGYLTRIYCLTATAILAAAPGFALQAAEVKDARVWAGAEYTRVVFDLSGPAKYKLSQQGDQVVLELADSTADRGLVPSAQGLLKGLSSASQGGALRLTASVAPNSQPKTFVLGPSGQAGYRLVLDLYPGHGKQQDVSSKAVPDTDNDAAVASSKPVPASADKADAPAPVVINASSKLTSRKGVTTRQAAVLLNSQRQVVVAVDAGHGGKDQGAHGPDGTLEKNVTLAVARNLAALINRQPGMKAVLTRDGDYFIPLNQRYEIARQNQADLFVSIHADSYTSSDAKGSSVWVLSPRGKSSVAAQMLADRENSSDLIGGVSLAAENDSLASVLLDMQQGWAVQASETVAQNVLNALSALGPTHRGYVERANFVVLRSPDVPSILVETAFISNPTEEHKLRDPGHQEQLATAIMDGVKGYFLSNPPPGTWFAVEAARRKGVLPNDAKTDTVASTDQAADADVRDMHRVANGETLRSIAKQYGVSLDSLKSVNGINSNSVRTGTMLVIPSS